MSKLVVLDGRVNPTARPESRASRFTHLAPLPDGRSVAWNALSGDLSLWQPAEVTAYKKISEGEESNAENSFIDQLWRTRHVVDLSLDEVEVARSQYDQERYGEPILTLTQFVRGPETGPVQPSMNAAVRAGIAALVVRTSGSLRGIQALYAGHEPLLALHDVGDLSLRLAEVSSTRRIRYTGAVQTNGVALTPLIASRLPGLEIHHVELLIRSNPGVLESLDTVISNVRAALEMGQVEIRGRIETEPENVAITRQVLERFSAAGLAGRKGFSLDLGGGVFKTCHLQFGLNASQEGTGIIDHAHRLGFSMTPALPLFMSQCQAVRSLGYVITANGDLHKCWSAVTKADMKMGNVTVPDSYLAPLVKRPRWMVIDSFSDKICGECSILPTCAGHCADLYPTKQVAALGDPNRPCPDLKQAQVLNERILAAARIAGILPQ